MKAYLVLFSIGLLFGTAVGLDCWQCNSLEESCEANTEKQQWEQDCEKQSYDAVLGLPSFFAPKIPFPLLEEARGMPKMNCVTFPNALKCYQCRGANSDCEKLKDVTEVNCESLMFGTSGYPDNFKPPFQSPMLKGNTPLCVHFAYDIQTYRGCMMTEKTELATQCNKLKSDFQNVNEPYTCDYCELDNCNGNSRITGHPFALLMASLLFIKGVLLH